MRQNLEFQSLLKTKFNSMGTIIIGVIAFLLLIYLFATMIYPEKF